MRRSLVRYNLRRSIAACSALTLTAAGCLVGLVAANASATTSKVIYVIGYQTNNPFWVLEGKGAMAAGKAFGVTVRYEAPSGGAAATDAGMVALADPAIATHPYGIAIDYTDKTMQAPVLKALAQGTKVVLYNNDLFEGKGSAATTDARVTGLAYVGQTNTPGSPDASGAVAANALLPYLPKHGTVLVVNPFAEAYVLTLRQTAATSALKAAGYNVETLIVNGDDPEASIEATIGAYITGHKGIVGIVGLGDPAGNPATRYVMSKHLHVPVSTIDMENETYDLMKTSGSPLKAAVDQEPYLQGYYAVEDLALEMKSGFIPVSVNTSNYVVTQSNLSGLSTLLTEGFD